MIYVTGLTDYLTEQAWEDTLIAIYVLVSERLPQALHTAGFQISLSPAETTTRYQQ
jgi:hypothetical protein